MAITYPLDFPTHLGMAKISMRLDNAVSVSRSPFTLKEQAAHWGGQAWEMSIELPAGMRRDVADRYISFLLKLKGRTGTFLVGDPDHATPRGAGSGTPLVNGAGQTGDTLVTDGWTPYQLVLVEGDHIQVGTGTDTQLFVALQDVYADSAGNASFDVQPTIQISPADNAVITTTNPRGLFRLTENKQGYDVDDVSHYGISFGARSA